MDMQKAVESAMASLVESGKIETMIEKKLEETVKGLIDDNLKSWSDFGKALGEQIKSALKIDLGSMTLPVYNTLVMNHVTEILDREMVGGIKKSVEEKLASFFKPLEKTEFTMTELLQEFIKETLCFSSGKDLHESPFTFIVERGTFTYIYIDKDEDQRKYDCQFRISIYKGEVRTVEDKGFDIGKGKKGLEVTYGFPSFLFKLYAAKANIIDDGADSKDIAYFPESSGEDD